LLDLERHDCGLGMFAHHGRTLTSLGKERFITHVRNIDKGPQANAWQKSRARRAEQGHAQTLVGLVSALAPHREPDAPSKGERTPCTCPHPPSALARRVGL